MSGEKKNIRQEIINREVDKLTDFLEEAIKNNQTPWRKEWDTTHAITHNPYTGNIYQGMNERFLRFNTLIKDYSSNAYLTFNNVKELGGYVKKGEKAQTLIHYSRIPLTEEDIQKRMEEYEKRTGQKPSKEMEEKIREEDKPFIKPFSVFNLDQCEIDYEKLKEHQIKKGIMKTLEELKGEKEVKTIEIVESILKNSNIPIKENGVGRAYYTPQDDYISLPPRQTFNNERGYYATALHELGHATGHESRLNRDLKNAFGTEEYAQEELRAELFSYLQGQNLCLNFDFDNHTSYLKSWQTKAKDGIREAVVDAFKMCDYVEKNWYPKQEKSQELEREAKIELVYRDDGTIEEAKLCKGGEELKPYHEKKENIEARYKEDERVRITPYNEKGEIEGLLKEYDKQGQLRLAEIFIAGERNGLSLNLQCDGVKDYEEIYKNDLLNGTCKFYDYDTRGLAIEIDYTNGVKNGFHREYYENGKIAVETPFVNGDIEGEKKVFYENGNLRYSIEYKNGKAEGEARGYYESGEVESIEYYKNGKQEGTHKRFEKDGTLKSEYHYKNGEINHSQKRVSPQVKAEQEKKAQQQGRGR